MNNDAAARDDRIRAVLGEHKRRRENGEQISDVALIAAHPELMPELGDELRKLRLIAAARDQAAEPIAPEVATRSHHGSDTGSGTGRLEVRCPNCHQPTEVAVDTTLTDLTCGACGSHFSLVDQSKATRMAPSLTKLGRFDLIERLGVGGFGSVWKARDKELDRTVAIKIPRAGDMTGEEQEKFFREARAAAQLRHPSIVSVHEVGRDGDSVYIVSDYVRGVTLGDWLTGQQLTSREAAELCAKIADALHHAHEQGVVHRDLKPANIMMDYDGQPHLMDFGLARRETGEITMTIDGQVLGTPAYMSPEQAQGEAHAADRRSDVYSLGVILFQLLTGELPFRGNARMLIKQVIQDEPPSPRTLNSNVPKDLETITLKCLEKIPSRRYLSAIELADELRRFLAGKSIFARPVRRPEQVVRWVRRNKTVSALVSAVIGALLVGAIISTYFAISARRQTEIAQSREHDAQAARLNAETVADFLVSAFEDVDPRRDGKTVTVAEMLDRAEVQIDQKLSEQPLTQGALLNAIGQSRLGLGQINEAIDSLSKAIDLRQSRLGVHHPDTLTSMSNLANAYYQLSRRRRDAVKLFEQIVEARRQTLGADHPDTLTSMHDLAVTYSTLGRRDEAIKLLESNITMRRAVLGPDHRDTLKSMYNLATSLLYQGRREDAINLLSDTLAAQRRVLGSDHLDTLRSINGLADAYLAANRREDAIPMYQECLAGRIRRVGAEHPDTATTMKSFADALESAGDHAQAIPLYEKVVTVRAKCFGYDHNATQAAIKRLLNTYQNAGRHRDAIKFLAVNLAASSEKLSVEHPFTLRCMNDLAFELSMLGNDEAAHEIAQLKSDDHLDRLRQVPAFQRLVIDFRSRPVFGGEQVKSVGQWTIRFYAFTDARKIESGDWTALIRGKPIVEKLIDRIDFSWDGSPAPGVPADNWITVATTKVTLTAGNYLFESVADDGVRVWIDDKLIIENWSGHPPMLDSAEVKLDSGSHLIKIAHFDYSQSALLRFGVARLDEKEPSRTKRE